MEIPTELRSPHIFLGGHLFQKWRDGLALRQKKLEQRLEQRELPRLTFWNRSRIALFPGLGGTNPEMGKRLLPRSGIIR
ncbi:hypothetical protein I7I51_08384 [Histoplasma capsulatum]|uniref:Uncharacterized protein n=1 Tax=Ajellomyces capsulatus TaxID=5037 RepID=A0A8A1M2Q1_AJECA|nr:hypothetical protein I7I51_08384 [Histoplasma capsulatum]